jgi:hypothetical protein
MTTAAVEALERRKDLNLFARGPVLVQPLRAALGPPGLDRPSGALTIAPVSSRRGGTVWRAVRLRAV